MGKARMSVIVSGRVLWTQFVGVSYTETPGKTRQVSPLAAKVVMLAIADSADDFGENSWQSFETIAEKASLTRRAVIRIINGLVASHYLSMNGTSRYGTNNYKVNLAMLGEPPTRRSRAGRPKKEVAEKTSDPGTETSDPGTETSDPGSPYPSLSVHNHPLGEGDPMNSEEYKARILAAMQRGEEAHLSLENRFEKAIHITPNWHTKSSQAFLFWLKERPAEQTIEKFAAWWYGKYWIGKQGQPPTLNQVQTLWPQAFLERNVPGDRSRLLDI